MQCNTQYRSDTQYRSGNSQPAVRSACEPCHERKIRCITSSTDGGPCDSCQSRRLSCFFLPRARSGRRPVTNHALDTGTNSPVTRRSSNGNRISPPQTPNSDLQNDHFNWSWTLPAEDLDQQRQHPSTALLDLDRPLSTTRAANGFGLQASVMEQDQTDLTRNDYQNVRLPDSMPFPATEMPNMAAPTPQSLSSEYEGRTGTKLGEKEFLPLLQLCSKLQGHVAQAGGLVSNHVAGELTMTPSMTPAIPAARLREMLEDIARSCDVIFGVYGQGYLSKPIAQVVENLDHASVSLAIAVIFKIFQVCDAVLSYNMLKNQGLNDLLLHKRLDFNLMQARIVIAKIEELTQGGFAISRKVALNASCVEQKLRAMT